MELPFESEKKYPCCSADVIIINDKDEVLLTKRGVEPYRNSWVLPGGRIKQESPVDAAIREVYEEIGVMVKLIDCMECIRAKVGILEEVALLWHMLVMS